MKEEIVKDYGELNVPTKWEDITLETFVKIMRMQEEKEDKENVDMVDLMALLTGKNREYINSLPSDFVTTIMAHLMFLNTPLDAQPQDSVEIDGVTYRIKHERKLSFGEYTAANSVLEGDKFDYASVLAILCRKENEEFNDKFTSELFDDRAIFWNSQPITKVYSLIAFFLLLSNISQTHFKTYLAEAEEQVKSIVESIENSVRLGDGLAHPIRSLKILWTCRKLKKCLQQTY